MRNYKVFGASLDALDLPEKVALKQAYVKFIKEDPFQDFPLEPYDAVKTYLECHGITSPNVEWIGKLPVESWLSPRPRSNDESLLKKASFTEFLDCNGCLSYSEKLTSYLRNEIHHSIPVMIGVDHSLTGGSLRYMADSYRDFNVLIFDSHTDIVDFTTKQSTFNSTIGAKLNSSSNIYECGSFLSHLLKENVIKPDRLWILGTQDLDSHELRSEASEYNKKMRDWVEQGVHLISKDDLITHGIPEDIEGPTYISVDMDIGCCSCVLACRFIDRVGLEYNDLFNILDSLSVLIREKKISLIGLDVMELDVHFINEEVEEIQDRSLEILMGIWTKWIFSDLDDMTVNKKGRDGKPKTKEKNQCFTKGVP